VFSFFRKSKNIKIISEIEEKAMLSMSNIIRVDSDKSNFSDRLNFLGSKAKPEDIIDTIVIHDPGFYNIIDRKKDEYLRNVTPEKKLKITIDELTLPNKQKSVHYVIDFYGKIYSLVDTQKRAWHAGVSRLFGKTNVNDFSIGIEVMHPFTEIQYYVLALLIKDLKKKYKLIGAPKIVGHKHISPNRKFDPLNFDFEKLYHYIYSE
jgi:hypothetical protein